MGVLRPNLPGIHTISGNRRPSVVFLQTKLVFCQISTGSTRPQNVTDIAATECPAARELVGNLCQGRFCWFRLARSEPSRENTVAPEGAQDIKIHSLDSCFGLGQTPHHEF